MKTDGLQIGDTVRLKDGREITVEAVHKRKIGYHATMDRLSWVFASNVEPVEFDPKRHCVYPRNCTLDTVESPFGGCVVRVDAGFGNKAELVARYLHEVQNIVRMYDNINQKI